VWAYQQRGLAYEQKGDKQNAKADFDKAKSLDPDFYEPNSLQ